MWHHSLAQSSESLCANDSHASVDVGKWIGVGTCLQPHLQCNVAVNTIHHAAADTCWLTCYSSQQLVYYTVWQLRSSGMPELGELACWLNQGSSNHVELCQTLSNQGLLTSPVCQNMAKAMGVSRTPSSVPIAWAASMA